MPIEQVTSTNLPAYRQAIGTNTKIGNDEKTVDAYSFFAGSATAPPFGRNIFDTSIRFLFSVLNNSRDPERTVSGDIHVLSKMFNSDAFKVADDAYTSGKAACTYGLADVKYVPTQKFLDAAWAALSKGKEKVTRPMVEDFLKAKGLKLEA